MKIVETSVKRPIGVLMIVIAVLALGFVSLRNLAVDLFPNIELPIAAVATSYSGASPEEIEKLITQPIESSLSSLQGIDLISSQSQAGSSIVILQFKNGTNMDNALIEVRERIDQIKSFLPDNAGDPAVLRFDPSQLPVMTLGLSGASPERLQSIAEDTIVPFLERQNGVASVGVQGGKTREIWVELDQAKLSRYGLSAAQVLSALQAENRSTPAGTVQRGDGEMQLTVKGEFTNLNDIRNTLVHLPAGGTVKVGDVAVVKDTFAKETAGTIVNGAQALILNVQKQSDANTVSVAQEVNKALEELRSQLPEGVELSMLLDTSEFITMSIDSVIDNLISGSFLAAAVLLLFLRSVRTTLVIAISIPISVISTFTLMYFTGETLNIISMGGLALGVGMMVDSSIVILENIYSYRQRGLPMKQAAVKGAIEFGPAVIASALTQVVVFVPMLFVKGLAADIFMPMALTITFSQFASLAAALTIVPMLSAQIIPPLKPNEKVRMAWFDKGFNALVSVYKKLLEKAVRFRKTTVFASLALFVGSCSLIPFIGMEFLPAGDQGQIEISIETPAGTPLEELRDLTIQVSELLEPYEDIIETSYATIGSSSFGGSNSTSLMTVVLVSSTERDISTTEVVQDLDRKVRNIAGAEINISELSHGFSTGSPIQIALNGPEQEVLHELADQVIWTLSNIDGIFNPTKSADEGNMELHLTVDREKAAFYGLTYQQILSQVQMSMEGATATRYREGGSEYDVKVILPEEDRNDLSALSQLKLSTPAGKTVLLSSVAELREVKGPVMIQRENNQRQINVTSDIVGRDLGSVSADVQAALSRMNFPDGYSYSIGGQTTDMMESFIDLGMALIFSIVLVYIVLAVQFESMAFPFVVMFAVPPTLIGVLFGLFVTNTAFGVTAMIGCIILAGVVVNNSIILVDYTNILRREHGMDRMEAVMTAAPSRVRPIMMTMLTTVLAMIPLALGIGEGAEMQQPLAIVVVFGLTFSTFITLVLVPVMYLYVDGFARRMKKLFRRNAPVSEEVPTVTT